MAKLSNVLNQTHDSHKISRQNRNEAQQVLEEIELYDTSHLAMEDLDFVERVSGGGYVSEGMLKHLRRIRDRLDRTERASRGRW